MVSFDYYRIFYFVCQYKSFTKAAEFLNNNQPNITRCMNNLEQELNCKLFVRTHRGVTLTPEGQRLYKHVAVAFQQLSLGEKEIEKDRGLESGLITIGASEIALRILLLDILETFHQDYPHVRLRIFNQSSPQAVDALKSGLVDFAVVSSPTNIKKPLLQFPLYSFQEILLGGPKYADMASRVQTLHELQDYPFISIGSGTSTRELYIRYFLSHNIAFQPDIEAATADLILPMIRHNLGIGFYPRELASRALELGEAVHIRLVEPVPERTLYLVRDATRPQSVAARKLIDVLKSNRRPSASPL
ncbi:LysR family transcriptional regulator [Ruminococcus sp. 5_1_39BFAA]|uniref:LysR family transcriptional regulator n=1 Tax=Ruminococcus sp. 5_1_39BFAA TaxID=457412 RepID=UPI00356903DA